VYDSWLLCQLVVYLIKLSINTNKETHFDIKYFQIENCNSWRQPGPNQTELPYFLKNLTELEP